MDPDQDASCILPSLELLVGPGGAVLPPLCHMQACAGGLGEMGRLCAPPQPHGEPCSGPGAVTRLSRPRARGRELSLRLAAERSPTSD